MIVYATTLFEVLGSILEQTKCLYDLQVIVSEFWCFFMYIKYVFTIKVCMYIYICFSCLVPIRQVLLSQLAFFFKLFIIIIIIYLNISLTSLGVSICDSSAQLKMVCIRTLRNFSSGVFLGSSSIAYLKTKYNINIYLCIVVSYLNSRVPCKY